MQNDYTSKKFKKWLDKLQRESWQLELLVSGFVIFGLIQAIDPLKTEVSEIIQVADKVLRPFVGVGGSLLVVVIYLLIFNLVFHLILRGLWIGAVGLRYYSGDIDYQQLNYSEKFTHYLKKKIGSFDRYIGRLEDYCSIIFSLTFLIVFITLSFIILFSIILLVSVFALNGSENPDKVLIVITGFFILGYIGFLLIALVDFLGQGILKKNETIAKLYFPFYWVMSYLSLSFIYRPILYNFLDDKRGRRILFWAVPFYLLLAYISSLHIDQSNFHNAHYADSADYGKKYDYIESLVQLDKTERIRNRVMIEGKRIERPSMQVFLFHYESLEDELLEFNDALKMEDDQRGIASSFFEFFHRNDVYDENDFKSYVKTLNESTILNIDTVAYPTNFVASFYKNDHRGYETYVDIAALEKGKHYFQLIRKIKEKDSIVYDSLKKIPFWYYPK